MKKSVIYIVIAICLSMPDFAHADFDIASYLQDMVKTAQKDGIGTALKGTVSDLQSASKDLVNPDFANISPDSIKGLSLDTLKGLNKTFNVDDKLPSGLTDAVNGAIANTALKDAAKKAFTVGGRSGEDVNKRKELEEKANDLMIENVSLLYAKGLVRRYKLDNEKVDDFDDFNNISALQGVILSTLHRANNRWLSILQSESNIMSQSSMLQMTEVRLDEEDSEADTNENNSSGDEKKSKFQKSMEWLQEKSDAAGEWVEDKGTKAGEWAKKQGDKADAWIKKQEEWGKKQGDKAAAWGKKQGDKVSGWFKKKKKDGDGKGNEGQGDGNSQK